MLMIGGIMVALLSACCGGGYQYRGVGYWGSLYASVALLTSVVLGMSSMVGIGGSFGGVVQVDQVGALFVVLSMLVGHLSLLSMLLSGSGSGVGGGLVSLVGCFFALVLLLLGVFSIYSGLFFFVCFELCVVPIFLLISKWGAQRDRVFSSYYMLFFSIITPAPLLLVILKVSSSGYGSFDAVVYGVGLVEVGFVGAVALVLGFLTKLPIYGLHIWLPKAHVDAPVGGSMVLAGVMLKMGGYGVVRLNQVGVVSFNSGWGGGMVVLSLGLVGFIISSVICLRLVDYKVIVAFSSVGHMSAAVVGLVAGVGWGFLGGLYVFVGHGIISPLLFYVGGLLYSRSGSRLVVGWGGLGAVWGAAFYGMFLLMFMFNFGFPPFLNFLGELGVFYGILSLSNLLGLLLFWGYLFSGIFMLNLVVSMAHGPSSGAGGMKSSCSAGEWGCLWVMVLVYGAFSIFAEKVF
uniref:NADH-ubiquinone oxidoreductase chain 4 n=1 Tax=Phallusia fumigata TaxID=395376 RepID=A7WL96_9ASCI|nr:NADH dehydrogenase subunit 4 [Phallusia fumigata]CAL24364.1 NADH dehydrogenase subunit 4 [Phallusia fumigata]